MSESAKPGEGHGSASNFDSSNAGHPPLATSEIHEARAWGGVDVSQAASSKALPASQNKFSDHHKAVGTMNNIIDNLACINLDNSDNLSDISKCSSVRSSVYKREISQKDFKIQDLTRSNEYLLREVEKLKAYREHSERNIFNQLGMLTSNSSKMFGMQLGSLFRGSQSQPVNSVSVNSSKNLLRQSTLSGFVGSSSRFENEGSKNSSFPGALKSNQCNTSGAFGSVSNNVISGVTTASSTSVTSFSMNTNVSASYSQAGSSKTKTVSSTSTAPTTGIGFTSRPSNINGGIGFASQSFSNMALNEDRRREIAIQREREQRESVARNNVSQPMAGNIHEGHQSGETSSVNPFNTANFGYQGHPSQIIFNSNYGRTGKDYPKFNGDPLKWAVFIANFENQNRQFDIPDVVNLERLERALGGEAWKAVAGLFTLPSNLPLILKRLKDRFGRPEFLIAKVMENINDVRSPKEGDYAGLLEFGDFVSNLCSTLLYAGDESYLFDYSLKAQLMSKLPRSVKEQLLASYQNRRMSLKNISEFLESKQLVWNELRQTQANFGRSHVELSSKRHHRLNVHHERGSRSGSSSEEETRKTPSKNCLNCGRDHALQKCNKFLALSLTGRWDLVRSKRLCFLCFSPRHMFAECKRKRCEIEGCGKSHHKLLHSQKKQEVDQESEKSSEEKSDSDEVHSSAHHSSLETDVYFKIVPVRLHNGETVVETLAFLDGGSSVTLINKNLSDKLNLEGPKKTLLLKWSDDKTLRTETESRVVSLEISGIAEDAKKYRMENIRTTTKMLGLPQQSINSYELKNKHEYLRGIPISSYSSKQPELLIGIQHWNMAAGQKVRGSEENASGPLAVKTSLGWVVCGPKNSVSVSDSSSHVNHFHIALNSHRGRDLIPRTAKHSKDWFSDSKWECKSVVPENFISRQNSKSFRRSEVGSKSVELTGRTFKRAERNLQCKVVSQLGLPH